MGIGVLRQKATFVVPPVYPPASVSSGRQGVVVREVRISPRGRVENTDIIEAPDAAIAAAVQDAVKRWRFTPVRDSKTKRPYAARSRLIFYFRLVSGKPVVIDAAAEGIASRDRQPKR